ncbi:MAG: acetate kinase [Candidatus Omnitrophica bacterium]|nr:acetate kinase [Candidatus Omnitrophota bacterium]
MLILVINCGSSSVKYKLYDVEKDSFLAEGAVEKIGEKQPTHAHKIGSKEPLKRKVEASDHHEAIELILNLLVDSQLGVIKSVDEISGVGHRVVHGGEEFNKSVLIDERVIASVTKFTKLAPLHNPPALSGIKATRKLLAAKPQVAVFDTAFHQTMPPESYTYALPSKFYKKYGIRRYGFHGTSHKYVAGKAAKILNRPAAGLKIIVCHLGNGCSMTAVLGGRSVDTSMGFTPLEGLVMGTRCGDIDPAIVTFLMEREGLDMQAISDVLNKKSGLLGLSEISNDMRELRAAAGEGNEQARLALNVFYYRIKKYIGAYIAAMNGIDAVVLTAGIGENNPWLKEKLEKDLSEILGRFNAKILVIPTKEEWMIAMETYEIIKPKIERS